MEFPRLDSWYKTHFKVRDELDPAEVQRKIVAAMEASQVAGLDGQAYVANKYILELAVASDEERNYVLSLIDEQQLSRNIEQIQSAKGFKTRGPLDFTFEETESFPGGAKLHVRALFDKNVGSRQPGTEELGTAIPATLGESVQSTEDSSVAAPLADSVVDDDEPDELGTPAAWAALLVEGPDGRRSLISINKPVFTIGRSRHGSNDLVLPEDGLVSKRHVRIELEPDGTTSLYDLASTNGTLVNGQLVPVNILLKSGDVIEIGQTHIQFQREPAPGSDRPSTQPIPGTMRPEEDSTTIVHQVTVLPQDPESMAGKTAKLVRIDGGTDYTLGEEAIIGRVMTCDIVVAEPTVSAQQARIQIAGGSFLLQDLSGRGTTIINGRPARVGERVPIHPGDRVSLGGVAFMFEVV